MTVFNVLICNIRFQEPKRQSRYTTMSLYFNNNENKQYINNKCFG